MLQRFKRLVALILVLATFGCATHGRLFTDDDVINYYWQRAQVELMKAGYSEDVVFSLKPHQVVWIKVPGPFMFTMPNGKKYLANGSFAVMEYKAEDGKVYRGMRIKWQPYSIKSVAHEACHAILWYNNFSEWESLCHFLDDEKKVWK